MKRRKLYWDRVKMTEGELALGMWIYVYLFIYNFKTTPTNREIAPSLTQLKFEYLRAHGFSPDNWKNACLLCQRYENSGENGNCSCCPLSEDGLVCSVGSAWYRTTQYAGDPKYHYKEDALEAVKYIIKVMFEEVKKDEIEVDKEEKR